ncbi:MAG: hypothetical protein ABIN58_03440, partial [candidate division WOR-3 bacterium]
LAQADLAQEHTAQLQTGYPQVIFPILAVLFYESVVFESGQQPVGCAGIKPQPVAQLSEAKFRFGGGENLEKFQSTLHCSYQITLSRVLHFFVLLADEE